MGSGGWSWGPYFGLLVTARGIGPCHWTPRWSWGRGVCSNLGQNILVSSQLLALGPGLGLYLHKLAAGLGAMYSWDCSERCTSHFTTFPFIS